MGEKRCPSRWREGAPRKLFGLKTDEVTGEWRRQHDENNEPHFFTEHY
jgi:hypothetical protein